MGGFGFSLEDGRITAGKAKIDFQAVKFRKMVYIKLEGEVVEGRNYRLKTGKQLLGGKVIASKTCLGKNSKRNYRLRD